MKYRKDKLDRKQVILEACERHPDCSLEEIGDVFGVTRQYVSLLKIADNKEDDAVFVGASEEELEEARKLLGVS